MPNTSAIGNNWTLHTTASALTQTVTLRSGLRMEYDRYLPQGPSNGKTIILLHGFPLNKAEWSRVAPKLAAQGYTVIAPNMRGYGNTDKPGVANNDDLFDTLSSAFDRVKDVFDGSPTPMPYPDYTLDKLAGDIKDLSDALGLEKPDLVGHDWGAIVGHKVMTSHSAAFGKYVAINGAPADNYGGTLTSWQKLHSLYMKLFETPGLGETLGSAADFAWLKVAMAVETPGTYKEHELRAYINALRKPGVLTAAMAYYKQLRASLDNGSVGMTRYSNQVLAISSTNDQYVGTALMTPNRSRVPNQTLVTLPGSHWAPEERPNEISRLILAHFA